jgi:hypothetical protein
VQAKKHLHFIPSYKKATWRASISGVDTAWMFSMTVVFLCGENGGFQLLSPLARVNTLPSCEKIVLGYRKKRADIQ